jgi:hypothetical protein
MHQTKRVVARTAEDWARTLGLNGSEAHEWQVQDDSRTHAQVAQRGGSSGTRVTVILNGDPDSVSSGLLIRLLSGLGYRVRVSVARNHSAA